MKLFFFTWQRKYRFVSPQTYRAQKRLKVGEPSFGNPFGQWGLVNDMSTELRRVIQDGDFQKSDYRPKVIEGVLDRRASKTPSTAGLER